MSDFAWGAFLSGSILLYTPETRQSITIFTLSNELEKAKPFINISTCSCIENAEPLSAPD